MIGKNMMLTLLLVISVSTGFAVDRNNGGTNPGPVVAGPSDPVSSGVLQQAEGPVLTLDQAVRFALDRNRELAAALQEIRALKGARVQAGLLPDPELSVEVENVGGAGIYAGTGLAETTISVGQLVELGGKRRKRARIADAELRLAEFRYRSLKRKMTAVATARFYAVLAAQQRVSIANELHRVAAAFYKIVGERVKAGKVSPVEEIRASVVRSTARIRLEKASRELAVARAALAAVMGTSTPGFGRAEGSLDAVVNIPERSELEKFLKENPEILKWQTTLEQSRTRVALARAARVPDLALSGGFRKFRESDDSAYVIGVSFRIPVWNRNRGGIMEARSREAQTRATMEFSVIDVEREFQSRYEQLSAATQEVLTIRESMLPASRSAYEAARLGYREGKFGFIEVLDAQRTYFDVEMQYVDALERYHELKADVEALIGRGLEELDQPDAVSDSTGFPGGSK